MPRDQLISSDRSVLVEAEARFFTALVSRARSLRYTIDAAGFVIGKLNGRDNLTAQRTERWARIENLKDGRFFIQGAKPFIEADVDLRDLVLEKRQVADDEVDRTASVTRSSLLGMATPSRSPRRT